MVRWLEVDLAAQGDSGGERLAFAQAHGGLATELASGRQRVGGFDFHDGGSGEIGGVYTVATGDAAVVYRASVLVDFHHGAFDGSAGDDGAGIWVHGGFADHFNVQIAVGVLVAAGEKG